MATHRLIDAVTMEPDDLYSTTVEKLAEVLCQADPDETTVIVVHGWRGLPEKGQDG